MEQSGLIMMVAGSCGFSVSTWLLTILIILTSWWLSWKNSRFVQLVEKIPGPRGLPVLGCVLELATSKTEFLRLVHLEWPRKYGPVYAGWGGTRPIVAISSPELMEPILSSQKLLEKGAEYSYLSSWLGKCMFLSSGARWRARRRLLTPAFHFQILESFFDVFNDQSRVLVDVFSKAIGDSTSKDVDVYHPMIRAALDVICETSMGKRARSHEENWQYLTSIQKITEVVMERAVRPWLKIDFLFDLSPLGRVQSDCVQILHDFTNKAIENRKRALASELEEDVVVDDVPPKRKLAFMDLLIKASGGGAILSDGDIREEVDTSMFAGFDTTGSAMAWFLYLMAMNPNDQRSVRDEVDATFPDIERPCTPQDLVHLKYLDCCIKETLRLYPSVPAVMRNLTEDVEIGGYTLPQGLSVGLLIYGMHRDPKLYPNPDEFRPERFFPENSKGRHPYSFIPFSAGPRNCIGQKYALHEMKVVLSTLMRHFTFSPASSCARPLLCSEIILKPLNGISVSMSPRR